MAKRFVLVALVALFAAGCGEGSANGAPTDDVAALEGTWFGVRGTGSTIALILDGSGNLLELFRDEFPSGIRGTIVEREPQIFELLVPGPMGLGSSFLLTDEAFAHAVLVGATPPTTPLPLPVLGSAATALMKPPLPREPFLEDDLNGTWLGYGYVFDEDAEVFEKRSPVTVVASVGAVSIDFEVTLPVAGSLTGAVTDFDADRGKWDGEAQNGDQVGIVMTIDKDFVGVYAWDPSLSAAQSHSYYALSRQ